MGIVEASTIGAAPPMAFRPAGFYRAEGDSLVCTLCPFACSLGEGDRGRCFVRRRRGGALETATFATAALHVHPIERKPFYHVRPGSRVVTAAAPGCTWSCSYCQNYRLSQHGRSPLAPWDARPLEPGALVDAAAAAGASIAFSYSEPVLAAELTLAAAPLARALGIDVVWKTNGFITESAARAVSKALFAVNVDLKAASDDAHERLTGAPLAPVLTALRTWAGEGVWIEVSTPLIPGFNTDDAAIAAMAHHILNLGPEVPWHLLRFHPDYRLEDALPTHPELFTRAIAIAKDVGLKHVYVERALGRAGRDTRCPTCGVVVIKRGIGELDQNLLVRGCCPSCGGAVAGRWEERS